MKVLHVTLKGRPVRLARSNDGWCLASWRRPDRSVVIARCIGLNAERQVIADISREIDDIDFEVAEHYN